MDGYMSSRYLLLRSSTSALVWGWRSLVWGWRFKLGFFPWERERERREERR